MFAMPLTGALAWFGHSDIAAKLTNGASWRCCAIFFHILGALMEHFISSRILSADLQGGGAEKGPPASRAFE